MKDIKMNFKITDARIATDFREAYTFSTIDILNNKFEYFLNCILPMRALF